MYGIEVVGRRAIVHAEGELDQVARTLLEASLEHVMGLGIREITVDLTRVVFLDSSAISALIQAHLKLNPEGGRLALRGASRRVQRVLKIVDLEWMLEHGSGPRRAGSRSPLRRSFAG